MSETGEGSPERQQRAAELAEELRAINEALAVRSFTADDLAEAAALARQIRGYMDLVGRGSGAVTRLLSRDIDGGERSGIAPRPSLRSM